MLSRSTFIRRLISTTKDKKQRDEQDVDGVDFDEDIIHQLRPNANDNYQLRPGTPLRPRSRSSTSQYEELEAPGQIQQPCWSQTSSPPQKSRLWVPRSRCTAPSLSTSKRSQVSGSIFVPRPHIVQRSGTNAVVMPPLLDGTAHSSASSLCSCDCHADETATPLLASRSSPRLCLFPPNEQRQRSSSVPRPGVSSRPRSPSPCPSAKELNEEAQTSTLNLLEALSLEPHNSKKPSKKDKGREGTSSLKSEPPKKLTDEKTVEGWSENVQQLIRETDEAFKAVGSVIEEAKLASQSFGEPFPSERHRTPPPVPSVPPVSVVSASTFPNSHPHSSLPPVPQPPSSPSPFPKRTPSNSKRSTHCTPPPNHHVSPTRSRSQRKRSPKGGNASKKPLSPQNSTKRKSTHPLSASKHNLRWTLTENVAELLNAAGSKLFNRIEADEMLTPQQIQELKRIRQQRLAEQEARETNSSSGETCSSFAASDNTVPCAISFTSTPTTTPRNSEQSDINTNAQVNQDNSSTETTSTPMPTPVPEISAESEVPSSSSSSSNRGRESVATINSILSEDDSETPVDSFHLDDLPSRISASEVRLLSPAPPSEPFSHSFKGFGIEEDGDIVRKDFSLGDSKKRPQPLTLNDPSNPELDEDELKTPKASVTKSKGIGEECMIFEKLKFPSPPMKSPGRSPKSKLPALPTIPEVTVSPASATEEITPYTSLTPRPSAPITKPSSVPYLAYVVENDMFLFLQSNPFTITQPAFRHGPIRFNKVELKRNLQIHALSNRSSMLEAQPRFAEDTLDWTAFQMALMGGAGDVFWNIPGTSGEMVEDEEDRLEREEREELEDDIQDWWTDIRIGDSTFDSAGRLLSEDDETDVEYLKCATFEDDEGEEDYPVGSGFGTPITEYSPVSLGETPDLPQNDGSDTVSAAVARTYSGHGVERVPEMQERVQAQGSPFLHFPATLPSLPAFPSAPEGIKATGEAFGPERYFAGPGLGLRRWGGEGHPKRYSPLGGDRFRPPSTSPPPHNDGAGDTEKEIISIKTTAIVRPRQMSRDTLPPSPMAPITVTQRPNGTPEVGVPMGFNLGHDLGDFLKWEADHAYAGGYYGPD
ncbi:hypothetical protein MKZ38_002469 [Zalerion maritima]|uniref:Uncharacterized protein n=1 Tax=Zalerion maritima TaxID=339359 RepID=A0AAD5RQ93_9PEZI|nr:hypothetical protein MKZ38_002469 [Zalerion maritima]